MIKSKKRLEAEERNAKAMNSLNNLQLVLDCMYQNSLEEPIIGYKAEVYVKTLLKEIENIKVTQLKTLSCSDLKTNKKLKSLKRKSRDLSLNNK